MHAMEKSRITETKDKTNVKTMPIYFFLTANAVTNMNFFLVNVHQVFFLRVLKHLQQLDKGISHQDNVSSHVALSVKQFLAREQTEVLKHPLYSPHLTVHVPET
jgi:hypothetical protein